MSDTAPDTDITTKSVAVTKRWRGVLPVHPAADLFPLMSEAELRELADDIGKQGQCDPVSLYNDPALGVCLLDGRNRLDAVELIGEEEALDYRGKPNNFAWADRHGPIDPYAYVISKNIKRRHLTAEQRRELIAKVLKAKPEASNRQIAEQIKSSHPTVAKVRAQLEQKGDVEKVSTSTDTKGRKQPRKRTARTGVTGSPEISVEQRRRENEALETDRDATQERWQRSLGNLAGEAVALPAYWRREFGEWEKLEVPSDLMTLAEQAAETWKKLVADLRQQPRKARAAS